MQKTGIWAAMLGAEKTIVHDLEFDEEPGVLLAMIRLLKSTRNRCGIYSRYDRGDGSRR